jgi:hypothetical protein
VEGNFTPDSVMALAAVAVFPVFIWFFLKRITLKLFLFGSLLLLVFSRGTLEILGISTVVTRIAAEALVIACFVFTVFMAKSSGKKIPGFYLLLLFSVTSFASIALNDVNGAMLLFFFRDYLIPIVFFYAIFNASMSDRELRLIGKLIAFLLISQIVANFIKVIVLGDIVEPYIGTMANLGGSLSIMFSLMGAVLSLSLYLISRRKMYLIVLLGFIAFSVIGEKRAAIVYIPFIYLFLLAVYQYQRGAQFGYVFKQIFLFFCVSVILVYASLRIMPSLNPERQVWGSFDMDYALDYSSRYLTTGGGAIEQVGRVQAPVYLLNRAASDSNLHLLFGYGAGHLIKSKFNNLTERSGGQSDLTMELYGVGYGARTAFLQLFLQVGLVGVGLYLALWLKVFRAAYIRVGQQYDDLQTKRFGALLILGFAVVFLIDFFTYSVVFVQLGVISIVVTTIICLCHQAKRVLFYE